jgi:hypothetical protein
MHAGKPPETLLIEADNAFEPDLSRCAIHLDISSWVS